MYLKLANQGKNEAWRYFIILLLVFGLNIIASLPLLIVSTIKALNSGANLSEFKNTFDPEVLGLSQNMGLFIIMAPLSLVFFGLALSIKSVHGYSWKQVFTSFSKFRWKNFLFSAILWFLLLAVAEVIMYRYNPEVYSVSFNAAKFLPLLLISLIFVPFQASWEELYFRGNLMQGLGIFSGYRWITLLITSVIFGLVHIMNPEVKEFGTGIAMAQYIGFGILLGITVIMDGGLEMAFGLHTMNNIYSICFVSYKGSVLKTPSVLHTSDVNKSLMTISFFIAAIIFLVILKKIFKWKSFSWIFTSLKE